MKFISARTTSRGVPRSSGAPADRIVVYDNGKLSLVEIEQKAAGLDPVYTHLKNPDFGEVAKAMDFGPAASQRQASSRRPSRPYSRNLVLPPARESQSEAIGNTTLALRLIRGSGRCGRLHRQGDDS
jgi:hypothetical protein